MLSKRGIGKKGQVAIFAIIAVVIIAIVLIFLLWPRFSPLVGKEINPEAFLKTCVGDKIEEGIDLLSKHGGSIEPVHTLLYQGEKIEYLCYTNEFYRTCVMQQPLLKQHVEYEINNYVRPKAEDCVKELVEQLESQGYEVSYDRPKTTISINREAVIADVELNLVAKKQETQSYDKINLKFDSNIYTMIMLASSILNYEARYGDSDIWTYMIYYPDYRVEKFTQDEGSKIYIITNRDSGNKFAFATRSLAWPAGYEF